MNGVRKQILDQTQVAIIKTTDTLGYRLPKRIFVARGIYIGATELLTKESLIFYIETLVVARKLQAQLAKHKDLDILTLEKILDSFKEGATPSQSTTTPNQE